MTSDLKLKGQQEDQLGEQERFNEESMEYSVAMH